MSDNRPIPESLLTRIGIDRGRRLFVPAHFDFSDETGLLEFIRHNPLAQLVSADGDDIRITAAALIHDTADRVVPSPQGLRFIGHLARRNPHAGLVRQGARAIALFQGPDAYISPRWNRESPSLPTWSYVAVQAQGYFEPIEDLEGVRDVLERTIAHAERGTSTPWRLDDAPPELVGALIHHIVAFRFHVQDIQGIQRLNQNRNEADRLGIVSGLRETGDPDALRIAELMEAALEREAS